MNHYQRLSTILAQLAILYSRQAVLYLTPNSEVELAQVKLEIEQLEAEYEGAK